MKTWHWVAVLLCAGLMFLGLRATDDRPAAGAVASAQDTDRAERPETISKAVRSSSSSRAAQPPAQNDGFSEQPEEHPSVVQLQRQFRNAETASQAQQLVALAHQEGLPVALDWEQLLDGCAQPPIARTDATNRPTLARIQHWQDRYCEGFIASESQLTRLQQRPLPLDEALRQRELTQRGRSEAAIARVLSTVDSAETAANIFMDFIANAESQEELDGILFSFQTSGSESAYFSAVTVLLRPFRSAQRLGSPIGDTLILEAAVSIYGCWLFGGCHAHSRPALSLCLQVDCQQAMSVEDVWRNHRGLRYCHGLCARSDAVSRAQGLSHMVFIPRLQLWTRCNGEFSASAVVHRIRNMG